MDHAVHYRTGDGATRFEEAGSLEAAVAMVERLRNDEGVSDVRVYRQVPIEFKTYYKVSVLGEGAPAAAAGAAASGAPAARPAATPSPAPQQPQATPATPATPPAPQTPPPGAMPLSPTPTPAPAAESGPPSGSDTEGDGDGNADGGRRGSLFSRG